MPDEFRVTELNAAYAVSRAGLVRTPRIRDHQGYILGRHRYVTMARFGPVRVDALVLTAFSGPPPFATCPIRHVNGNTLDCRIENLRWDDASEGRGRPIRRVKREPLPALARFDRGLHPARTRCPRCEFPLLDEPALKHCVGCGRYFPVYGARIDAQYDYEMAQPGRVPA